MNRDSIIKVADAIEAATKRRAKPAVGFNMSDWTAPTGMFGQKDLTRHKCGTTACIGGWAFLIQTGAVPARNSDLNLVAPCARAFFDLTAVQADELFLARHAALPREDITPAHAVAVLRNLAATGVVDWTVGAPS